MSVTQAEGNPFGIAFVDAEDVPAAPRKNERNDALWEAVKAFLPQHAGQWAQIKIFSSVTGAQQKAGSINNGHNKVFPKDKFEARYTVDRENETSTLFMRYNPNGQ